MFRHSSTGQDPSAAALLLLLKLFAQAEAVAMKPLFPRVTQVQRVLFFS